MSGMVWENPPERKRGRVESGRWRTTAGELRKHPGRWAKIAQYPSSHSAYSLADRVRHGRLKSFEPGGAFEARAAAEPGGGSVWARYTGGPS